MDNWKIVNWRRANVRRNFSVSVVGREVSRCCGCPFVVSSGLVLHTGLT